MDVIHAWEASYGGTALRVDGKFKDGQVGVQRGIASSDANKNVDWKRTKSEIVFPKYTRTIQVGASPVIAEWTKVMKHATDLFQILIQDGCPSDNDIFGHLLP